MLAGIIRDNEGRADAHCILVFLGDFIDRGPNSKAVVERLIHGLPPEFEPHFLKGNHEDFFLSWLSNAASAPIWLRNGGKATLSSYEIEEHRRGLIAYDPFRSNMTQEHYDILPPDHLEFYLSLKLFCRLGDYFFVHAGVRPGIPLDRQTTEDLLWIRHEFLNWPYEFGAVIVHGHTPVSSPQDLHNRIGIDTYAWMTGHLTAVALEGSERWFLTT